MKVRNLNASSQKTRQLIKDTFARLLHEKRNVSKISVTELVKCANINRSTFYSHFDDIWQVAEDIKAETMKAFFENKTISCLSDIEPFLDEIYCYIRKNDDLFRLIFISDEVTGFVQRLGNLCKGKVYAAFLNDPAVTDKNLLELEISTFSDGMAMQFIRYYHNDYDVSLENIITFAKVWSREIILRRTSASPVDGIRQAKAMIAFNNMRSKAASRGFMSEEEIEAEIAAARNGE